MSKRLLIPLLLLLPLPSVGQTMTVEADVQVKILLKVLTYDRQFESKAAPLLKIGIVYVESDATSVKAADDIGTTLNKYKDKPIKKIPFSYVMVKYTTSGEVEQKLKAEGINLLYVAPGNTKNLADLVRISQAHKVTTMTGIREYVVRDKGLALGVAFERDKPRIYINLPSSKSEGSEFDASLLQIAEVQK
jgi:uncharacterized protein (UPF0216 family)